MKFQEKPLVTIITVTFNLIKANREKFFRQNLESIHSQTYPNIEHIIIDGASTDGTIELIREYADMGWIKYISELDSGIYNAMNSGVRMAKGKYIAFLNSDDYYHDMKAVELSVSILEKEQADFSYANFLEIGNGKKRLVRAGIENFLFTMPFGHLTMFAKTSAIKEENGFDEKFKLPADYDLIIRLILKNYKGVFLDKEIATYRLGGLGCLTDHSNEITQIYLKNYSAFYDFSNSDQARKIMYELIVPKDFPAKFRAYAYKQRLRHINVKKIVHDLEIKAFKNKIAISIRNKLKERISNIIFVKNITSIFKK